jgi:hypothetical protein
MKKFLLLIAILGILFLPLMGLAGTYQADGSTVTYEGLVPCGKKVKVDGAEKEIACQFCHFFVMLDGILDFVLFKLVIPIATLMIVIAGIMYIGAIFEFLPGGFKTLSQAKEVLTGVVLGLFIIFGAWLILNLFFTTIGVASWTKLGEWFRINCSIKLPS